MDFLAIFTDGVTVASLRRPEVPCEPPLMPNVRGVACDRRSFQVHCLLR